MPELKDLYIRKIIGFDIMELRIDWSNDRHHSVKIEPPFGPDEVKYALMSAFQTVNNDPTLKGEQQ